MPSLPVSGRGGAARGSLQPCRELHPPLSIIIIIIITVIISSIPAASGLGRAAGLPRDAPPGAAAEPRRPRHGASPTLPQTPECPGPHDIINGAPRDAVGSFSQVGGRGELRAPVCSPRSTKPSWHLLTAWGRAYSTWLCPRRCQHQDGLNAPELEPRPTGACPLLPL